MRRKEEIAMRILMSGGGTAGHVNPALAIAQTILQKHPDAQIRFVCSMEPSDRAAELVPRAGYPLERIRIKGAVRPLYSLRNIRAAMLMVSAKRRAAAIIRDFKPDIIIGTGGFVCWPVVKAGAGKGIPTLLHESNAAPGLAVRMLKEDVDKILCNFPETADRLGVSGDRVCCVGNPLLHAFSDGGREDSRKVLGIRPEETVVLAFGGSGGAKEFNRMVMEMMTALAQKRQKVRFVFATGPRYYDEIAAQAKTAGIDGCANAEIYPYLYDMPLRMQAADLVICRAGAMTLSEVAQMGKAAIMIPSPNVTDNHQYKNAKAIADADAGILLEEGQVSAGGLTQLVCDLLDAPDVRARLGRHIRERFAKPDANERIYDEIMKLCGGAE